MSKFAEQPVEPLAINLDREGLALWPEGPVLTRRLSALEHLFADTVAWRNAVEAGDPVVYTVRSSPVPELKAELPQSVTTILPGAIAGEFYMTKGHQHQDLGGEVYLGIEGTGGLLMFNGSNVRWLDMEPDTIGYIPPGWAHRSVNTGAKPYSFLAVYPGAPATTTNGFWNTGSAAVYSEAIKHHSSCRTNPGRATNAASRTKEF